MIRERGYSEIFALSFQEDQYQNHDDIKLNSAAIDIMINEKNILSGNLEFVSNSSSLQNLTNVEFLQDLYNLVMDSIRNNLKNIENEFNESLELPEETYVFREEFI